MRYGKTRHELRMKLWGVDVVIPKGTVVRPVKGGMSIDYAISSTALVAELSGNTHDAIHRYAFVPFKSVELDPWPSNQPN